MLQVKTLEKTLVGTNKSQFLIGYIGRYYIDSNTYAT